MGLLSYALSLKTAAFDGPLNSSRGMLSSFGGGVLSLTGKLAKLSIGLAAIAGPAAAVGLAFKAFNATADLESTQIALRTLVGDVQLADETLNKIRRLAASTPFQFPELAAATRKLIAFDEAAADVPNTLRRIGDVAAGAQAPISELAELYGKARVQGTLYAEDLNQLRGRGISIFKEAAKILGVNASEVKKLASEGKITFPILEQAFINLTSEGGRFYDMMKQQSGTTNGLISTLKDSFNEILLVIGQPINDMLKPMLVGAIDRTKLFGIQLQGVIELLRDAGSQGQLGSLIGASLQVGAVKFVNTISGGVRGTVAFLAAALPKVFGDAGKLLFDTDLMKVVKHTFLAIGASLKASLLEGAAAILEATKIPGYKGLQQDARIAGQDAKNNMNTAGFFLREGDFAADAQKITNAISDGLEAGSQAWKDATSKSLIDEGPPLKKWEQIAKSLNPDSAARILKPSDFVQKELTDTGKTRADGLPDAINTAKGNKEKENTEAIKKNTIALDRQANISMKGPVNAGSPLRGGSVFSAAESLARRFGKMTPAQRGGKSFNEFISESLGGKSAVQDFAKRNKISLAEARERLVALAKGADPGKGKKAAVDPQISAAKAMLEVVKNIDENLENVAVA